MLCSLPRIRLCLRTPKIWAILSAVRRNKPNSQERQSRRGVWEEWRCRVRPLLLDRYGISERIGVPPAAAKDLKLVKSKDHAELSQRATELKRMLTALLQKLNADR
jgi:hypothetical protein